jgi:hypothetical protein
MSTDSRTEERIDSLPMSKRELAEVYTIEGIDEKA